MLAVSTVLKTLETSYIIVSRTQVMGVVPNIQSRLYSIASASETDRVHITTQRSSTSLIIAIARFKVTSMIR